VAFTQPYLDFEDRYGSNKQHVLAVIPGESALLLSIDRFLGSENREVLRHRVDQDERVGARRP
jgi:hypothetical protein